MIISRRAAISWMLTVMAVSRLPGRLFGANVTETHYEPTTTGPGRKFSADGRAQHFPGNTILCHLNQPGRQLDALREVVATLREQTGDENITWLPPSSYHMTIFDGSNVLRRDWPTDLNPEASLQECNDFTADRLRKFDLGFDPPIRMVADENSPAPAMTGIPLRPVDGAENERLRNLRDRLAVALGIRRANHENYAFHTTFGYYIKRFSPEAGLSYRRNYIQAIQELRRLQPVIELGAPEYCLFDNMASFRTQFFLTHRKES
jgi:hypothetical protein